jgi:phage FluMu protein Com
MLPRIAIPKYDMIVPSTGKSITYRPYVVKEEKLLLIAMESEDEKEIEKAITGVIETCLDGNIKVKDLTSFDIEFIFLTLRAQSVGQGIKVNIKCDKCETENEIKIDLNKLEIKNNDFDEKDLQVKITDDITVDLRWPTMSDRSVETTTGTETIIHMAAKSIGTLYSGEEIIAMKDTPFNEVVEFVESFSSEQFNKIISVLLETPYVSYDIKFTCKKCKEKNEKELKGLSDFFQ